MKPSDHPSDMSAAEDAFDDLEEEHSRCERNRLPVRLGLLLCKMLLIGAATFFIITSRWWWVAGCILAFLWASDRMSAISKGQFQLIFTGTKIPEIKVGVEAEFWGLYHPHWEVGAILVLKGFSFFGVIPVYERWMPSFADPSLLPPGATPAKRNGPWPRYWLNFKGVPSEEGNFGHMGINRRRVHVVAIIDSGLLPDPRQVWM